VTRYRCVDDQKAAGFPVAAACQAAGVSTSAYYAWAVRRARGPSQRQRDEAALVSQIRSIHDESDGTYGAPRVTAELARRGWPANHKRVARLMRRHGIAGHRPRRRRSLTKPDRHTAPASDLVGRLFDPYRPDHTWCGDLTCIRTDEGWLYLASVLDLGSRRLLGWSMADRQDAGIVTDALEAAVAARGLRRMHGTIFHSDRGAQYTSAGFAAVCDDRGIRRSMGRTGSCLDNAVAEAFFATFKVELCDRRRFATRAEARQAVFAWIARYNHRRLHSTIGYLPPVEWERQFAKQNRMASPQAA
jgi:transposase InsO family protein